MRPVTLCTLQWTDLDIEEVCRKARGFGYDGLELACCGNHLEVDKADDAYCNKRKELLKKYGLKLFAAATHLASQCVCDNIDELLTKRSGLSVVMAFQHSRQPLGTEKG